MAASTAGVCVLSVFRSTSACVSMEGGGGNLVREGDFNFGGFSTPRSRASSER